MSNINEQVIKILKQAIEETPDITELDLEFKEINDLLPYLDYLGQLKSLRKLNLFGNRLRQLPVNMEILQSIEELDLANNMLDKHEVEMNVQSLKTMPNLRVLCYPVSKQKQQVVIDNLFQLQYLNSKKIIRNSHEQSINTFHQQENFNTLDEMNQLYKKLIAFQKVYIDEIEDEQGHIFQKQNRDIATAMANNNSTNENYLKYQLYCNLQKHAFRVCKDIYGDLGKFIEEIQIKQNVLVSKMIGTKNEQSMEMENGSGEKRESFEGEMQSQRNSILEKEVRRLKKQKDQMMADLNLLQNENKKYLEIVVKYSRGDKSSISSLNLSSANNSIKNANMGFNKSIDRPKVTGPTVPSHNVPSNFSTLNYNSSGSRLMTIKQLKDTIQEIYESKLKFDQKNSDGKMARETMHQYLYTYLNQKYGLKSLTIENANNIISGIQAYSAQDNDVAVFGKILRNEIDEEFRNVQNQLKSTINNLLKMHIKSQHPYKSVLEIQQIFNEKTSGQITSEQANDIVRYLYNKTDADIIMKKLDMLFKMNKPKQGHSHRRMISRDEHQDPKHKLKLKFTVFLKTVLDFQLKNHEKLLKPLVDVFKLKDEDANGIIEEQQFIYIVEQLCEEANDIIPELLMIVDPNETGVITFTQVVKLVANYPQNNPILSRFIKHPNQQ